MAHLELWNDRDALFPKTPLTIQALALPAPCSTDGRGSYKVLPEIKPFCQEIFLNLLENISSALQISGLFMIIVVHWPAI